jgi:hypothetical protein
MRPTRRAPRHCFAVRSERLVAGDCRFAACGIFEHFTKRRFEFFLLPNIVHAPPPATSANRQAEHHGDIRDTKKRCKIKSMMFAIKAEVSDPGANVFAFSAQKTMYGGKLIAAGDTIFIFASENSGGPGLIACGIVTSTKAIPKKPGIARQTPRLSISIRRTALAKQRLGRDELKQFSNWNDGRPETELNFKFYRQATNKIVGISNETSAFLRRYF